MCNYIMKLLLFLEKYSTSKDDNKVTYVMIPADHKVYPFPYNMEDRLKSIIKKIMVLIDNRDFDYIIKKEKNGSFEDIKNLISYTIEVKASKYIDAHIKEMEKMGFKLEKNTYTMIVN